MALVHFLALQETRVAVVGAERHNLHRLGPKQIPHRVDAVDPDVVERSPAQLPRIEPDVAILHLSW